MPDVAIVIPFRDRGTDPNRQANLECVLAHWERFGYPVHIVDDGRSGEQQFNRHAAYNKAAHTINAQALVYTESDMLIHPHQVDEAITAALDHPHLVVPFTERHELNEQDTLRVRAGADHTTLRAQVIKPKPRRVGAINVITKAALHMVGQWDEQFEGSWWDDRSMHLAFDKCCGPTQWIEGPAWHLHHLPGWTGPHLTAEDRAATKRNKARFEMYRKATTAQQIRELTT